MIGYGNSMVLGSTLLSGGGGSSFDPDAQAFITAAAITNTTQQNAINALVLNLKSFSLFTLPNLVIYPMVGGSNSSTSYNLINPALFQISWVGGVVSSNDGVQFNGVNSYGNTGFKPATVGVSQNSFHISFYSKTNNNNLEVEIGGQDLAGAVRPYLITRYNGNSYYNINSNTDTVIANTNSQGFYTANRTASNVINGWKNGTKVTTGATVSTGNFNSDIWIGAMNNLNGAIKYFSSKQCAGATIGPGLTDTQAANLRTAMQTFNTTLGRQV